MIAFLRRLFGIRPLFGRKRRPAPMVSNIMYGILKEPGTVKAARLQ